MGSVIPPAWRGVKWPPESLEAEEKAGVLAARLYPFTDREVETPKGKGTLLQVFSERVMVLLHRQKKVTVGRGNKKDHTYRPASFFRPEEVKPVGY